MEKEFTTSLLEYGSPQAGRLECTIDLQQLFETEKEHKSFLQKWPDFLTSDPSNKKVYELKGNTLHYLSEELLPTKKDNRPPLLLLLGNPASHSIDAGMFFSFEANQKEHRFWKSILRPASVLELYVDPTLSVEEKNNQRRKQLLELDYKSPYRVGLSVFLSLPSGASDKWSGVAGIQRLLGTKAMRRVEREEKQRVLKGIQQFCPEGGAVVCFQKNAWNNIKAEDAPEYSNKTINTSGMLDKVSNFHNVALIGVPPTRLAVLSGKILRKCLREVSAQVNS